MLKFTAFFVFLFSAVRVIIQSSLSRLTEQRMEYETMLDMEVCGRRVRVTGSLESCEWLILQPEDAGEEKMPEEMAAELRRLCPDADFALAVFSVDWWRDLTPWPQAPLFKGQPPFGDGAEQTLGFILEGLIPALKKVRTGGSPRLILGGYSLAGLFALWAGYQCGIFEAVAAASPSVWYPGWTEYAAAHRFQAGAAYLSLGDREANTRNPVMRTVGEAIRVQNGIFQSQGILCILEWNPGNHFADAPLRMAKGYAYCLYQEVEHR